MAVPLTGKTTGPTGGVTRMTGDKGYLRGQTKKTALGIGTTNLVDSFLQDTRARASLGIGGSRLRSRVVNPFGSGPLNRAVAANTPSGAVSAQSPQAGVSPVTPIQTEELVPAEETTQTPATSQTEFVPAGTYQYLDLLLKTDVDLGPDHPFYSLFASEVARKVG